MSTRGGGNEAAGSPAASRSGLGRLARAVAFHPVLSLPGYWVATGAAATWGVLAGRGPLRGRIRRRGPLLVADTLPSWAFGRGGTTIGGVFLTSQAQTAMMADSIYAHEAVHRAQWRRFGLWMIPLYLAAGRDPMRNRFEIEAGLEAGGYTGAPLVDMPPIQEYEDLEPSG